MSPLKLDSATHARILGICERGDAMVDEGDLGGALGRYREALELVPKPVDVWEATTWILTAIGDVLFHLGRYEEARDALNEAMHCPGALGNAFIHLRFGQAHLELQENERASDELARAYMAGGDEIFDGEVPKYREHIQAILRPTLSN